MEEEGSLSLSDPETNLTNVEITDDKGWDTDLESEDGNRNYDNTGKATYMEACKKGGVVPVTYFIKHMNDSNLQLRHHGLGPMGTKAVSVALVSNTNVLKLDLSDNWLGPSGGHSVCEMLKENCYITELNLSDNKLGTESAKDLSDIIQNSNTLTHITLSGNDLDDKAAEHIAEAIMNTQKLEFLDLSQNKLGEVGGVLLGPAISENSSIKEMNLSWNCIRAKGAVAVAQGIKNNVFMKKINLDWNGFGNEGAIALGDALKGNSVLEELDISNNRINTEGAVLFGKGLMVNESLKVLKIGMNPMQSAGCFAILTAVLKNPNNILHTLDFSRILVNTDFLDLLKQVQETFPELKCHHGGMEIFEMPEIKVHPMVKIDRFLEEQNLRLIDFFCRFDEDHSMSVTHEEFAQGMRDSGINMTEDDIQLLLGELDRDGDGEVNYSELVVGFKKFIEDRKKLAGVIKQMKAQTDAKYKY
ncbi:leucine-rich repeat-containing protein 74B [Lingula anatina]|uniref:Leucine-rich repeat-containing protein 74B n=1 Tax=Lingula anatina TaxID=7574 RepID=A0A1S3HY18_LINAN|nr:leucine-rich repeat-containing protein 74B [Lingula anatina]|eukprot:XP_013389969.1 leucine-rich repeat-containing protein 74B [Lingula anatina]